MKQFLHPPLHRNPDIPANSAGPVPVNDFEKGIFLLPRNCNFMLQASKRFLNRRPISLEIRGLNCNHAEIAVLPRVS